MYNEALAIFARSLPPDHADVALTEYNLASLYQAKKRFPEAETMLRKSLAIRQKVMSPDDPEIAKTLSALAVVLEAQSHDSPEKLAEAEQAARESLRITRKSLRADHPDIARSLLILAGMEQARKNSPMMSRIAQKPLRSTKPTSPPTTRTLPTACKRLAWPIKAKASCPMPRKISARHWRFAKRSSAHPPPQRWNRRLRFRAAR